MMSSALEVARRRVPAIERKELMTVRPFPQDFFCFENTTPCGV